MLPPELLVQIRNFMEENKQLGFTTKEEFIRDAIRFRLTWLKGEYEYIEVPKEQYALLEEAVREMNTLYRSAEDFVNTQVKEITEKYKEWKKTAKRK